MTIRIALPPIPAPPTTASTLAAWQPYLDIAKLHRTQEREEAYDAEMLRHNLAMEAESARSAAALEAQSTAAVSQASNTYAMVAHDQASAARREADRILSVAKDIFIDRTATTTSITNRAKMITDSVADAMELIDAVNAALAQVHASPPGPNPV